jgi:hypothetical protein
MLIAAWSEFIGANQRLHPKRLPEGVGVNALNLRPGSADLRGWRAANVTVTTGGETPLISLYRMNRAVASDTGDFLQWSTDVDVVRSLIGNDSTEEIYYTGDGAPKRTDNTLALPAAPGPAAWRWLGIPKPTAAMTATLLVAGTGTVNEYRVYVDEFVNAQGRESAPGVNRAFTCLVGSTVTLNAFDPVPSGYPDVTVRRIYVSTDGGDYLKVAEVSATATSVVDDLTRGSVLQSGGDTSKPAWESPPSNLKGLTSLWNGMVGGFFGKTYTACQPNKPWAWPVEYQETLQDDIVGTGKWLQNWLILTTSAPYLVTGGSPLALSNQPIAFPQSCVSKRSIVSRGDGVCWASPNGLCFMGQGGSRIVTEGLLSPEQWQALVPSTIVGARFERYYLGFYNDGALKGFLIDPVNPSGIIFLGQGAMGVFYDPVADRLFLQDTGNVIRRWNHPSGSPLSVTFKTAIHRHAYETNAGYALIVADQPVSVAFSLWASLLQADGTYVMTSVFTRTVTTGEAFALPSGYLARDFQVQMVTTGPVQGVMLAESPDDFA